jgi:hypothetical protein
MASSNMPLIDHKYINTRLPAVSSLVLLEWKRINDVVFVGHLADCTHRFISRLVP